MLVYKGEWMKNSTQCSMNRNQVTQLKYSTEETVDAFLMIMNTVFVVCIMLFIEIHPIGFFHVFLVLSNLRGCESTLLLTTFGFGCSIHCIVTTTFFVQTAWFHIQFGFFSSN